MHFSCNFFEQNHVHLSQQKVTTHSDTIARAGERV